jgi:hypothetical protein
MTSRIPTVLAAVALALAAGAAALLPRGGEGAPLITMYRSSTCPCCHLWGETMERAGFRVRSVIDDDQAGVKERHEVPWELTSCHTSTVEGYVLEGHVPAGAVRRLLDERPALAGVGVGGMPAGSPGMPSLNPEPYEVKGFAAGAVTGVYERRDAFGRRAE